MRPSCHKVRPPPYYNITRHNFRQNRGPQFQFRRMHGTHAYWWKTMRNNPKPFGIELHTYTPRILLDRHMYKDRWELKRNIPDASRWEKVVEGMRTTEDRWALVEEEGMMHKINWKLYSKRVEAEMLASFEHVPQFRYWMASAPMMWRKLDLAAAKARQLSLREAMAQMKFGTKRNHILLHALEAAQQGAEGKGLDKDKLRIISIDITKGPTDKAMFIMSRGYYSWKTMHSANVMVVLGEDPEMVLPDRTTVPYRTSISLAKAGISGEPTILDVPALTADGI